CSCARLARAPPTGGCPTAWQGSLLQSNTRSEAQEPGMMPSVWTEVGVGMEIRAWMRQLNDGRWEANADSRPPVHATGSSRERCMAALHRALKRPPRGAGGNKPVTLIMEVLPLL